MGWEQGGLRMEGSADKPPAEAGGKSKMMIIAVVVVAILVVAAIGAALLMSGGEDEEKVLVVATIDGNPESLDPAVDYETVGGEIIQNVYETLMFYDGASAATLKPMLCTAVPTVANGLITDDGYTYTYNLREGVMFHDGNEMTSEDVFYSFARALRLNDPHGPVWMVGELLIPDYYDYDAGEYLASGEMDPATGVPMDAIYEHIWMKDDYTVQFNLTVAFPGWNYVITFGVGSIISKAFVEANGGMTEDGYTYMFNHMCGTGAFYLEEFVSDTRFVMTKHEDYWQGEANLDKVIIMQVPDPNTRLLMIKSGEADVASIPRTLRATLDTDANIRIIEGLPTFNIDFIGLNQNIKQNATEAPNTNVPADFFTDRNVRLAFAHAMNASLLIETQFNGAGIQPNGAIPKGLFGYDEDIPVYTHDLDLVKSYLENATFVKDNVTTNWLDEGFGLDIFYNTGNTVRQTACEMFKDGLEAANPDKISITVKGVEWATYLELRKGGAMPVLFLGWAPDYADPNNYMQPFYHSAGTYAATTSYVNHTVDALIEEAAAELDPEERATLYSELSMILYEECVHIWTVQATNFHVERVTLEGYTFNPMYSGMYYYPMDK